MSKVIAVWTTLLSLMAALLFWRNWTKYRGRRIHWIAGKTILELGVVWLTAWQMPVLLITWLVLWTTRPIKRPWVKTVAGVIAGVVFGLVSNLAMEILMFFGLFAIDMKTGEASQTGFLHCWKRAKIPAEDPLAV